jgi:hypothetical protein
VFETHQVKPHECLWNIAKARFGTATLWPSIYSFNNWAAANRIQQAAFIRNPNLIHPRQIILLPDLNLRLLRPIIENKNFTNLVNAADKRAASQRGLARPSRNSSATRHNPASYLGLKSVFALEYDLDRLPPQQIVTPVFTAEVKFGGKILMQPEHDEALVKLSNHGFITSKEFQAKTVLGDLTSGIDITWKPGDKKPSFSCNLTRAGHGPIPQIALEEETGGPKFVLTWKPFHGHFHSFEFIASCYAEITIKPNNRPSGSGGNQGPILASVPPAQPTITAGGQGLILGSISGPHGTIVARNPSQWRPAIVKPTGIAPLIGMGLLGLFAIIASNPEILLVAAI